MVLKEALNLEKAPRLDTNQALIFSSTININKLESEMNEWLDSHPLIFSSLESKGLEFDDCLIAFDADRKAWDVGSGGASSLTLVRELYVAITRAKQRVVILVKSAEMRKFFKSLQSEGCIIEEFDAKAALHEFQDPSATKEEWFEQGMKRLRDEQFKIAANCFKAAGEQYTGYFQWAQ